MGQNTTKPTKARSIFDRSETIWWKIGFIFTVAVFSIVVIYGDDFEDNVVIGFNSFEKGEYLTALKALRSAEKEYISGEYNVPLSHEFYLRLSFCEFKCGNKRDAQTILEQKFFSGETNDIHPAAYRIMIEILLQQGRSNEASQFFTKMEKSLKPEYEKVFQNWMKEVKEKLKHTRP